LHLSVRSVSIQSIETGVLHEVGLRNTLEPDPDNTGVGSFRDRKSSFLELQRIPGFKHVGNKESPCSQALTQSQLNLGDRSLPHPCAA
jgi:hypothetical protein